MKLKHNNEKINNKNFVNFFQFLLLSIKQSFGNNTVSGFERSWRTQSVDVLFIRFVFVFHLFIFIISMFF